MITTETAILIGFAVAGAGFTILQLLDEVSAMQGQHWVMLAVVLVVGYVLGVLWKTPAQMVGLSG